MQISSRQRGLRALIVLGAAVTTVALAAPASAGAGSHSAGSQLLVKFDADVSDAEARDALVEHDALPEGKIPRIDVRVASAHGTVRGVRRALADDPDVAYVERNAVARAQETVPSDPYFPQGSYALGGGAWGWYRTHATEAWDVTQGDPGVTIAILDTGLRPQALDFGGQLVGGYNVLNGSTDTSSNAGNHGTYVAGVAGLAINNASGNAGYCPGCKIMPVQVGTDSGANYSSLATGITWAVDHGARVLNLSWAGTTSSSTLASAVSYARSKGAVVFAAAGNSNCNCPTYPSATPGVLGVGGVTQTGAKANDSNYGSWVAVAAPEGNMTAWPTLNGAPGYAQVGGTSVASPAAAGIAGLLFSANPGLSGAQVENALEGSAKPTSFAVEHGELDAMAALRSLGFSDPQAASAPVNTSAPRLLVQTSGSYNTGGLSGAPEAGQVLVRGQGAWTGSSPLTLGAVRWYRCNTDGSACAQVGTSSKYTVQSADNGYALKLTVTVTNPNGTASASALSGPVGGSAPAPPPAPVNGALPTISGTAEEGQMLSSSTGTWANSPTSYGYQWARCDSAGGSCVTIAGATSPAYAVVGVDVGSTLRVTVTASNDGGSASAISAATAVVQSASVPAPPPEAQTQTFSGSLNGKAKTKSYGVTMGAGVAHAELSFTNSKCKPLTLGLSQGSSGLATKTGPSVLPLDQTVAAGSYAYTVSGPGCSFTLTVTSTAP